MHAFDVSRGFAVNIQHMCPSLTFPTDLGFNPFPLIIVNMNFIALHLGQI